MAVQSTDLLLSVQCLSKVRKGRTDRVQVSLAVDQTNESGHFMKLYAKLAARFVNELVSRALHACCSSNKYILATDTGGG